MYIENKYWNHYIGDTDDSLTLVDYLADRQRETLSLTEIFSDTGLDRLNGDFRTSEEPLTVLLQNTQNMPGSEMEAEFYYAIDLVTDLAALLLECRVSGSVDLRALTDGAVETPAPVIRITATPEEHQMMNKALAAFAADPLAYDLSEMCPEEDLQEMAVLCESLRKELYG